MLTDEDIKACAQLALERSDANIFTVVNIIRSFEYHDVKTSLLMAVQGLEAVGTYRAKHLILEYRDRQAQHSQHK